MGCNCGGAGALTHQVVMPNGTIIKYPSEVEARAAAEASGGIYQAIRR